MFVIERKKLFITISSILVVVSLLLVAIFGLDLSIEFTGGAIAEAEYAVVDRPDRDTIAQNLSVIGIANPVIQPVEDNRYAIRTGFLTPEQSQQLREMVIAGDGEVIRESSIGPSVGRELRTKAILAIIVVSIGIIAFIAFAFRRVSLPVKSWKYGAVAIIALLHDIIIPTGIFALLGYFVGYQVDLLFVMGILVILGYSVNDTIVVFDRVRENLLIEQEKQLEGKGYTSKSFAGVVGESLNQTFARSLNTSLTTLMVLICLYIFGGESTNHFALMLIVGIASGTYSSIFLASPLLVYLAKGADLDFTEADLVEVKASRDPALRRANMTDPGLV